MKFRKPRKNKTWKKYCDDLWKYIIKLRDNFACQYCGKRYSKNSRGLQAHHIFSKGGHPRARFDLENGVSLCTGHHRGFAHAKPYEFKNWLIYDYEKGKEWWENLQYSAKAIRKYKLSYEKQAHILEEVIKEMEND